VARKQVLGSSYLNEIKTSCGSMLNWINNGARAVRWNTNDVREALSDALKDRR
jgi:hypothetical protein